MKVRVIKNDNSYYNKSLKVISMNYDMLVAQGENEKVVLNRDDVSCIPENCLEETIVRCRDIVKIKLNHGISMAVYASLIAGIEEVIGGTIRSIEVLKDDYSLIRKGLWEKKLILVVNEKTPLDIDIIGRNYSQTSNMTIKNIAVNDFVDSCRMEIDYLKSDILQKQKMIKRYENNIDNVINRDNDVKRIENL